jgi:uncharacterized protein (DUF58 family)
MSWQAVRDFLITVFFLGLAFTLALLSSVAAERNDIKHAAIAAAVSLVLALLGALYIIPRLARNVRLEILRFAVRTTVTVEGLLFVVFLVVIGFAAWNTGNNLLYLILSAMLAFLIAANVIARRSLADVSVQLRFPDHIFAGEPANLTVTIVNHKRFMPTYSVSIEAVSEPSTQHDNKAPENGNSTRGRTEDRKHVAGRNESARIPASARLQMSKLAYFVLAPAGASARQKIEHTFARRGRYPITGFRISTKFPAGFFKKWRTIDASGEILVYPKPQPLDDFYHTLPMLAGRLESQARGSGDDLYAIRRYHPSDHMRHIDWKATAKSMEMMVHEHMREDEWRLTIVFDTAAPPESSPRVTDQPKGEDWDDDPDSMSPEKNERGIDGRFERAVIMAASLANHFMLERADVELITSNSDHNVPPGSGYDHLYKILKSLAILQPTAEPDGTRKTEGRRRRSILERFRNPRVGAAPPDAANEADGIAKPGTAWRLLDEMPVLADERRFKVLITSAPKGSIPANVWRSAHVVFMEDL